MSEWNLGDFGNLEVSQGGAWEPIPEGTYEFEVDSAEWTATGPNSKRPGTPMLTVEFIGTSGEASGQKFTERVVLMYKDRRSGKDVIHWNVPLFARAAGGDKLFPEDAGKRATAMKNFESWAEKVKSGLIGKKATITLSIEPGREYPDRETGEMKQGNPQNRADKIVFEARAKASTITV